MKEYGSTRVIHDVDLDIEDGEFAVFVGPSGCGKSTLLRMVAGLEDITAGDLYIGDEMMNDVPPAKRGIAMVFQSYALYPHLTTFENMAFGLRLAKRPKAEIEERVMRAAGILQIEELLNRKPKDMSGGQRQRVAIGRAIVRNPEVFLFDEPLSNLDAKLRTDLRVEIKRLHQRLSNTMIYVTHDQIEAMTLADRIAIMRDGLIQQLDTPYNIYNNPVNKYVAGFIGSPSMNFLEGSMEGGAKPVFKVGNMSIPLTGYDFTQKVGKGSMDGVTMGVRPEHVLFGELAKKAPFKADVTVEVVEPMGADTLVWSELDGTPFRFRVEGQLQLSSGDVVSIGFDPARGSLFDAEDLRI
ncbi:MAG: sn-glycerol-3-phosphate ABC transporter ATP-binding protein UgpC [Pseudomonadota bacterium]|nr:sn-glycerol-3-phosphate ABC transporter ATP-binding protein UgpC [Pseudomonadota bacterium]